MEKISLSNREKEEIKTDLKYACERINKALNDIMFACKVDVVQKLELFDNLFISSGINPFEVKISQTDFRAIKKASKIKIFRKNKALKMAIDNAELAIQRQFFRNYEILNLLSAKLESYLKTLKSDENIRELMIQEEPIGKITSDYRNRRVMSAEFFQKEIKEVIDGIKKGIVVDNLQGYCKLFNDFFEQELDYLTVFQRNIKVAINNYPTAEEKVKGKTKIPEFKLDMPTVNEYL